MRFDLLFGSDNVVRFPVELRAPATFEVLWGIAPDLRAMPSLAEAFGLELPPHGLRDAADAETAAYIGAQPPVFGAERRTMLDDLLRPVLTAAVTACRRAHEAAADCTVAEDALHAAETSGGFWLDPLRERAETRARRMAELFIVAHARSEEAWGVARAVGKAQAGEPWHPQNSESDTAWLLQAGRRSAAR